MPEDTLSNQILDARPKIYELNTHARTAEWNKLGIQLKLDDVRLAGAKDSATVYQVWLQEKGRHATRRNLLAALRAIKLNAVADDYVAHLQTIKTVSDTDKDNLWNIFQSIHGHYLVLHTYKIFLKMLMVLFHLF